MEDGKAEIPLNVTVQGDVLIVIYHARSTLGGRLQAKVRRTHNPATHQVLAYSVVRKYNFKLYCFRWHPWKCFRSSSIQVLSPETQPLSRLQSLYTSLRNAVFFTNKIAVTQNFKLFLHHFLFPSIRCLLRYDLDACDIQEKYPDLFQVNLNIEVDPRDKPSTKTPPWEGFQSKGLNPKILFSSRDEQQEILSKFGG